MRVRTSDKLAAGLLMYTRLISDKITSDFFKGKAVIVVGARQTGKTTLIKDIQAGLQGKYETVYFNGDDPDDVSMLNKKGLEYLKSLVSSYNIIFIDEGHKIPSIGDTVKMLVDEFKQTLQVVITASSTLNLLDNTNEPLTGRKFTYTLHPLSIEELYPALTQADLERNVESLLLYGTFPGVTAQRSQEDKTRELKELSSSYLYKDILEFQKVKGAVPLRNLIITLALRIGSEFSYLELQEASGLDRGTVERYIELMEKSFILFRLYPYSPEGSNTLSKKVKVYFWDLGIRNSLINNFNPLALRNDVEKLWENFLIVERMKHKAYLGIETWDYFWKTYDGAEMTFVEQKQQELKGYTFSFADRKSKDTAPQSWTSLGKAQYEDIHKEQSIAFMKSQV
jgi:uncharacterized protein